MPLLSQEVKEIWHIRYNFHQLLQMHQRKHSFWLYHSLVWLLSAQDRKELQKVVNVAQSITQTSLPSIDSVYTSGCLDKAASIIKDPTHPGHSLFHLLPSGKRYKSLRSRNNRTLVRCQEQLLPCCHQTFE